MKLYIIKGSQIIQMTFGRIDNVQFLIMAIADVFDAVSKKRCYRQSLPFECFEIIANEAGSDFDLPLIEVFLDIKDQVIEIYQYMIRNMIII